ncbi:pilus assembly protein CpaB [uncultured Gammaproteobacteria bacterium]
MLRFFLIAISVVVALFAGVMVKRYMNTEQERMRTEQAAREAARGAPREDVPMTDVLIMTTDLPIAGTLKPSMLGWQGWPKANVNQHYMTRETNPDAIKLLSGSAARQPLFAGEPVTEAKFVKRNDASFLATILPEDQRAFTVQLTETNSFSGLIQPGDRVDVLLTYPRSSNDSTDKSAYHNQTETIARNLKVIAIDSFLKFDDANKTRQGRTATLQVDPQLGEVLSMAQKEGQISLMLRSAFGTLEGEDAIRATYARVPAAIRDLPAYKLLAENDITWITPTVKPELELDFIEGSNKSLRGALLLAPVSAGQTLNKANVIRPSEAHFISMALRPGLRAVAISVEASTAVSGFITPGDIVDVVFVAQYADEGGLVTPRRFSDTILRGIRCLSLEYRIDVNNGLPVSGGTATLELTPRQVEIITTAAKIGKLVLTLRPTADYAMAMALPSGFEDNPTPPGEPLQSFSTDIAGSAGLRWLLGRQDTNIGASTAVIFRGSRRDSLAPAAQK